MITIPIIYQLNDKLITTQFSPRIEIPLYLEKMSGELEKPNRKRKASSSPVPSLTGQKNNSPISSPPLNKVTAGSSSHLDDASVDGSSVNKTENQYDSIRHCIVTNDGTHENLVRLIGLKTLFAKQLPKMPKEYIVRLVFDRRHKSLALLSDDLQQKGGDDEIIGGICYRAYPEMRFAEIAFCAVSASQQVKVSEEKVPLTHHLKFISFVNKHTWIISYNIFA